MILSARRFILACIILGVAQSASFGRGELAPHPIVSAKEFHYIGDFFGHHLYVRPDANGSILSREGNDDYMADAWWVEEDFLVIFEHPTDSDKFAIHPMTEVAHESFRFPQDLKYWNAEKNSTFEMAWRRSSTPDAFRSDWKQGKSNLWVFVADDFAGMPDDAVIVKYYVTRAQKKLEGTELRTAIVIVETVKRSTVYLSPHKKKVALVRIDSMATPLEKVQFRDLEPGSFGEALWRYYSVRKQPR